MTEEKRKQTRRNYTILLVDDHPIVCQGLAQLIQQEPDMVVCGQAARADEAMALIASQKPDCVITDLAMEGRSGLELIKDVIAVQPTLPIIVLTMYDEMVYAERALRAGAMGFVMKRDATDNIICAIRRTLAGEIYVSKYVSARLLRKMVGNRQIEDQTPESQLSDRELEVFRLIGEGKSSKAIADMLGLSIKTIETYREHIKKKLHLANARELIQHAIEWTHLDLNG
ncbi:MAG: response regulator transcription factor [Spartobacteria bacterium]|nr:response regulator transcription factor [Spartobacteria bacterium]